MRKGDHLDLECGGLDDQGAGLARVTGEDGAIPTLVHIPRVLPGEKAAAVVDHVSPHIRQGAREAWASLTTLGNPSPDRVTPACPAQASCGGCVLQHLAYPAQTEWKRAQVVDALGAAGLGAVPVGPCVPSPRPLGYRNQAKYVFGREPSGRLVLGAFVPRSHDVVDLEGCQVIEPPLDEVSRALRSLLDEAAVAPFVERTHTGLLRYVTLRANAEGQVLVTLVTNRRDWPGAVALAQALQDRCARVTGVVQNVNSSPGNVVFGPDEFVLAGEPTVVDAIGNCRVRLSSRSFFQVNRHVAALAYDAIRAAAAGLGNVGRVLDAYAGAGGIALSLGDLADEVIGIDENAAAIRDAEAGALAAGFSHLRFVTGDVAERLTEVAAADLVVLNPPRAGCAPGVIEAVGRMQPRLVAYLSCNPRSLARDLALLAANGVELGAARIVPFDMLPHTPHVETLCLVSSR